MHLIPETIREFIEYNPKTGELRWLKEKGTVKAGTILKSRASTQGYVRFRFNQVMYLGHRVAWFLHYGTQPPSLVDHENRIRNDNRISNLRDASDRLNALNAESLGYYWSKSQGCFHAQYLTNGKKVHLGLFECPLIARLAYVDALKKEQVSLPLIPSDGNILGRQGAFLRKQGCQKPNGLGYTWINNGFNVFYRKTYLGREYCPLLARYKYVDAVEEHQKIRIPLLPEREIKGRRA